MLNRIKGFANTEDKRRLLSNFISLSVLQGANYILPLITFPYLVRVLGVEYFGLLAFATATVAYFNIITDYGFNLTATREISIHRDDKAKVTEIFSSVVTIKFGLMIVGFLLLAVLVFSFEKFAKDWKIYFLTFGRVIGQVLFPVWFFQGMERMKYITYLNIFARLIFTVAIFIFVKSQSDYYMVPILNSLGVFAAGFWSFMIVKRAFGISFKRQKKEALIYHLKEAHHIFIANVAISLYTTSTTFILGLFTSNTIVGYYAAADKIIQAFKSLMTPMSQTIYPYVSKKFSLSKESGLRFIRRITLYVGVITATVSLFILLFSRLLVNVVLGSQYGNSVIVLRLLAFTAFMIGLSNVFGIQTMLPAGRKESFSRILIAGSILNIILSLILVPMFEHLGSAICVLLVETFITVTMFVYLQKNGLRIIGVPSTF